MNKYLTFALFLCLFAITAIQAQDFGGLGLEDDSSKRQPIDRLGEGRAAVNVSFSKVPDTKNEVVDLLIKYSYLKDSAYTYSAIDGPDMLKTQFNRMDVG